MAQSKQAYPVHEVWYARHSTRDAHRMHGCMAHPIGAHWRYWMGQSGAPARCMYLYRCGCRASPAYGGLGKASHQNRVSSALCIRTDPRTDRCDSWDSACSFIAPQVRQESRWRASTLRDALGKCNVTFLRHAQHTPVDDPKTRLGLIFAGYTDATASLLLQAAHHG